MWINKAYDDYYYDVSSIVSIVSCFIKFIVTYFYSSFRWSFSSKLLLSTDTLQSIQEPGNSDFQFKFEKNSELRQARAHYVRPVLTVSLLRAHMVYELPLIWTASLDFLIFTLQSCRLKIHPAFISLPSLSCLPPSSPTTPHQLILFTPLPLLYIL